MRQHLTRSLPYAPQDLFSLVGDVERYPEFVPWIVSVRTWNPQRVSETTEGVDAEVSVGFALLKERFATRVRRDGERLQVDVSLLSGPFRRLVNRWRFTPSPQGTRVDFEIDFELRSRLLEGLVRANLHHAVDRLMACFEARAAALYGPSPGPGLPGSAPGPSAAAS